MINDNPTHLWYERKRKVEILHWVRNVGSNTAPYNLETLCCLFEKIDSVLDICSYVHDTKALEIWRDRFLVVFMKKKSMDIQPAVQFNQQKMPNLLLIACSKPDELNICYLTFTLG